uniref:Uncharacterized protein n=1 Tax=Opuntia streptacantha TaxID=393608 RepID=A0A7C8YX08_OPUST
MGAQREGVLGKEAHREGRVTVLDAVHTGGRRAPWVCARGRPHFRTQRRTARHIRVCGRFRRIEHRFLLLVAALSTWGALCPCKITPSVKNEGEILFGSAKANSDNVIARADGASGLSREAHSFLTNPVRLNHAGGQPGFHSPLD